VLVKKAIDWIYEHDTTFFWIMVGVVMLITIFENG